MGGTGAEKFSSARVRRMTASICFNGSMGKEAMRREIFALSTPAIPRTFTTEFCRSHGGFGNDTSHCPPRTSVVIGTTTDIFRSLSGDGIDTITQGRVLAATPSSTITTSPRLKFVIINFGCRPELLPTISNDVIHH